MRCFLAIDIPAEIRHELFLIQNKLRKLPLKAKFVEKENFHLTLKFIDGISVKEVNLMRSKLKNVKFENFKVSFGKLGVFPSIEEARVIWISLEPEGKVKELHNLIDETLESEDKRFESHVTLARIKELGNVDIQKKLGEITFEKKEFEISNFVLKKSTVTREGPIYEDLKVFNFD